MDDRAGRFGALFGAAAVTWTMWMIYAPIVHAGRWVRLQVFR